MHDIYFEFFAPLGTKLICSQRWLINLFKPFSLRFADPPSNVMVSISGSPPFLLDGTTTTLDCSATAGDPSTGNVYIWTRANVQVQALSTPSSFTFTPTVADDGVTYSCEVSNGVGTNPSASISVTVYRE